MSDICSIRSWFFPALPTLEELWTRRAGVRAGVRGNELYVTAASPTLGIGNVAISALATLGDVLLGCAY